ncbi:MAG: hypothetical protein KF757_06915 [Phycisphaeraceae bacterium]|nr:hypothetical protein [Phycisphaeraceae bacterium]MCW5763323.1 hypothetical protein [Phycisphaeraceae bacterium]
MRIDALVAACGLLAIAGTMSLAANPNPIPAGSIDNLRSTFMDDTLVVYWGIDASVAARQDILDSIGGQVVASGANGTDVIRVSHGLAAAHAVLNQVQPTVIVSIQNTDIFLGEQYDISTFELQSLTIVPTGPQRVLVPVLLDGGLYTLELAPFSSRAPNFKVLVDDGSGQLVEVDPPAPKTWRGRVVEMPGSMVAASIDGSAMTASILLHDNVQDGWFIQPLSETLTGNPANAHIVYHGLASVSHGHECGGALPHDGMLFNPIEPNQNALRGGGHLIVEMAYDGDFQFYQQNGSNLNNTIADIENVQNGMIVVYERDCGITFVTTQIIVRTSSAGNPYTTSNAEQLLGQFGTQWIQNHQSIHRDLAHLMTGRNMGGVLGIAWLQGVCSISNGYGVSRSRFTTNFAQRTALTAHEVGHNLSAPHCSGSTCRIMCASLGGCGGIGLPNFSVPEATGITNFASNRWCIDDGSPPPNDPPTVFITTPQANSVYNEGSPVFFSALASDPQDGNVAANLVWTSNIDGAFGNGAFFQYTLLSPGAHTITASVIDAGGLSGEDQVQLTINAVNPPCPADRNGDGELNFFDIQHFLDAFAAQNPSADMNGDSMYNFFDVQIYLDLFSQGCP